MTDQQHTATIAADVMATMINMLNYLDVSLYQSQLTLHHQQSLARLNEIYATVSKRPNTTPSNEIVREFYNTLVSLRSVTETEDANYDAYMRTLRYIATISTAPTAPVVAPTVAHPVTHYTPSTPASWYGDDSDESDGELEIDMTHRELREWTDQIRRNKDY
jgi:hypothetical protein